MAVSSRCAGGVHSFAERPAGALLGGEHRERHEPAVGSRDRTIRAHARQAGRQPGSHSRCHYVTSGPNFGQNDTNQVLRTQRLIAALKRQGIYSCLSIYFPLWVQLGPENTAFPGYTNANPFALLYFNPQFQSSTARGGTAC